LSAASSLEYLHLAYLSKPVSERVIYRKIGKSRPTRLVVLGLGNGELARRMIRMASRFSPGKQVTFTGIDLFEMRTGGAAVLSLRDAYRLLCPHGAKIRLVPGDPQAALATAANSLLDTDMVVVRADQDADRMRTAWFYVPRMLHAASTVLIEQGEPAEFRTLDRREIEGLARARVRTAA